VPVLTGCLSVSAKGRSSSEISDKADSTSPPGLRLMGEAVSLVCVVG